MLMPRKRKSRKFTWVPVNAQISLSTLGDDTVLEGQISTLTEDFYCHAMRGVWSLRDHTANEGPLNVGFSHSDYDATEIEECLDAGGTFTGPGTKIEQEHARRLVRSAGVFPGNETEEVLADGEQIQTAMKFVAQDGKGISIWCKNQSGGTLTTGAVVRFTGHAIGRWLL